MNIAPINKRTITAVGVALVEIGRVGIPSGVNRLGVAINVEDNAIAMDQCEIRGKIGDREVTLAGVGADFTSPADPIIAASGDVTLQAANTTGWVLIDPRGFESIVVYGACAAAGPTDLTVDLYSDVSN